MGRDRKPPEEHEVHVPVRMAGLEEADSLGASSYEEHTVSLVAQDEIHFMRNTPTLMRGYLQLCLDRARRVLLLHEQQSVLDWQKGYEAALHQMSGASEEEAISSALSLLSLDKEFHDLLTSGVTIDRAAWIESFSKKQMTIDLKLGRD